MNRLLLLNNYSAFVLAAFLLAGIGLAGCDLLEVNNPNNLVEEELDQPASATAMANGAEASVTRALGAILAPYSTATDELTWIGSRDAWNELDIGIVSNVFNEFSDAAFPYVGEARWATEEYIRRMEGFHEEGILQNERDLVRTYLYGAIIYTAIADMFDDFTLSNRREGAPPVGEGNMNSFYDTALDHVNKALDLVDAGDDLEAALIGMRARIKFSQGVWDKVNPAGQVNTGDPLVNSAGAAEDAQQALDLMSSNFIYQLELSSSAPDLVVGDLSMALQVNSRQELRIGDEYIYGSDERSAPDSIRFRDAITDEVHPHLAREVNTFTDADQYADMTIVSAREMHLILAEVALAQGDEEAFAEHINDLRDLDGLAPFVDQVDPMELLVNQRQANLFLQGRRLADHYRFDELSPNWTNERDTPGTFFPITITEIRANPNLDQ